MEKRMHFDYSNLKAEISRNGLRLEDLSAKTGISVSTLSTKIKNGVKFDCEQAWTIARVLGLDTMDPYFFIVKL